MRTSTRTGVGAAELVHLALLDGAQQLGLEARVHLAHLVQQQGAAIGLLELALAARRSRRRRRPSRGRTARFPAGSPAAPRSSAPRTGPRARRLRTWTCRASTSLPVPLSPVMRMPASDAGELLRPPEHRRHGRVAVDRHFPALARRRFEHRGDEVGVGRQRQEVLGAGADGAHRGFRVHVPPAGDHRAGDPLLLEPLAPATPRRATARRAPGRRPPTAAGRGRRRRPPPGR